MFLNEPNRFNFTYDSEYRETTIGEVIYMIGVVAASAVMLLILF